MPKTLFTARWVETALPPKTGQTDYFDTKPPGVGLRISAHGRKTWFVMYRVGGRLRRLTLGPTVASHSNFGDSSSKGQSTPLR